MPLRETVLDTDVVEENFTLLPRQVCDRASSKQEQQGISKDAVQGAGENDRQGTMCNAFSTPFVAGVPDALLIAFCRFVTLVNQQFLYPSFSGRFHHHAIQPFVQQAKL